MTSIYLDGSPQSLACVSLRSMGLALFQFNGKPPPANIDNQLRAGSITTGNEKIWAKICLTLADLELATSKFCEPPLMPKLMALAR